MQIWPLYNTRHRQKNKPYEMIIIIMITKWKSILVSQSLYINVSLIRKKSDFFYAKSHSTWTEIKIWSAHLVVIHFFHPLNGGSNEQWTKLLISVWEISFFFLHTSNIHFKRVFTFSLSIKIGPVNYRWLSIDDGEWKVEKNRFKN